MKQGQYIFPLSWSVHCNFTGDGKCNERGWACTLHPYQPGLILPSWWNVRQKAAVTTLCTLWYKLARNWDQRWVYHLPIFRGTCESYWACFWCTCAAAGYLNILPIARYQTFIHLCSWHGIALCMYTTCFFNLVKSRPCKLCSSTSHPLSDVIKPLRD